MQVWTNIHGLCVIKRTGTFRSKNDPLCQEVWIPPAEMRIAYRIGPLMVVLSEKCARVGELSAKGQQYRLKIFSVSDQEAVVFNLSKKPILAEINNIRKKLPPGGTTTVHLPRTVENGKEFFYANDFLNEPEIYRPDTRTPY